MIYQREACRLGRPKHGLDVAGAFDDRGIAGLYPALVAFYAEAAGAGFQAAIPAVVAHYKVHAV